MRLSESPMPNILFFLSAMLIEVLAWSGLHLFNKAADSLLMTYFIVHAVASILFAFSLRPLILASHRLREHRLALLGLVALVSFTIPIAGAVGCLVATFALYRYRNQDAFTRFPSVTLPEFDQYQSSSNSCRPLGLKTFLSNQSVPTPSRMRAMVALSNVSGRLASPMLRTALSDSNDDLRLLAYSMLDNKEQKISQAIHDAQQSLERAHQNEGSSPLGPQGIQASWALSDLYWEMIYQGIAQSDVREHAIAQSLHYCLAVLQEQPDNALLTLRKGRLMQLRKDYKQAQDAYEAALEQGLPAARVVPYLAEIYFLQRDFSKTQRLMQMLDYTQAPPSLRPSMKYWSAA